MFGRQTELAVLDGLVAGARAGQSQVLVLRGEAGIGKTALLEYLETRAVGCHIVRLAGVEAEMELAYAGLHQLCAPFLDRLNRLPDPHTTWVARGRGGQLIAVVPEHQLVVVIGSVPTNDMAPEGNDMWLWVSDVIVPALEGSR